MKISLQEKTQGLIRATAVHDALFLPTEGLTKKQIQERFTLPITQYLRCPESHPCHKEHFPSRWSDDTQLKLAVMCSLNRKKTVDLLNIAQAHVESKNKNGVMGWGKGSIMAVERLEQNNFNYKISGSSGEAKRGKGNGVIMKLDPLSMFMHYSPDYKKPEKRLEIIEDFTRMTHDSTLAVVTAALHDWMINELLNQEDSDGLDSKAARYNLLQKAFAEAQKIEATFQTNAEDSISHKLKALMDHFDELQDDETLIKISDGGTFYVSNSLTMTYGLFFADPTYQAAYRGGIIGGDTDSNSAMVAAQVSLLRGPAGIPKHLDEQIWRRTELVEEATTFSITLEELRR